MSEAAGSPDCHWDEMRSRMESGGAQAVVEFIQGFGEREERRRLYSFAQRSFGNREWQGKNLDSLVEIVDAGIAEGLRQSTEATDPDAAKQFKDFANILSYNLSADLAECWPDDTAPREGCHFERGLKAAEDCLRWRVELNKPPFPLAIAYWAKGMHLLSLRRVAESIEAFESAVDYAKKATPPDVPPTVSWDGTFIVVLNSGYRGLARQIAGDNQGRELFEQACHAFEEMADRREEEKEDAEFGLAQLRCVENRMVQKYCL